MDIRLSGEGYVAVTLPTPLIDAIDSLAKTPPPGFSFLNRKSKIAVSAAEYWLANPELWDKARLKATSATISRDGVTGWKQRRVELGPDLVERVRKNMFLMSGDPLRPVPMAQWLYTALDHYIANVVKFDSYQPTLAMIKPGAPQPASSTLQVEIAIGKDKDILELAQVIRRIRQSEGTALGLRLGIPEAQARSLLDALGGNSTIEPANLQVELTRVLAKNLS